MSKRVISKKAVLATLVATSFLSTLPLPSIAAATRGLFHENAEIASESFSNGILVAGLRFRLPVRASRWRIGGLARSCAAATETVDFEELQRSLFPIAPPVQSSEELDPDEDSPVDYTVSAHPTIFIRVPDLPEATVKFTLQNEEETEDLYATQFELDGAENGIVGIHIPTSSPSLEIGQKYVWKVLFSSPCEERSSNFRLATNSWIERVEPQGSLTSVSQVPLRDRPDLYAEAGIWQETISSLAELRMQNSSDASLNENWSSLMESVNLGEYASEPILRIHSEQ